MKIKTADLIGPALDWAVATCEGYECQFEDEVSGPWLVPQEGFLHDEKPLSQYSPSTNWAQGVPIIEREGIEVVRGRDLIFPKGNEKGEYTEPLWLASCGGGRKFHGQTPLIAAMRCYVASKLGDEADVPDELV